ncbi:cob(I)yrinic acid a,c-diamide adenosyltransferase [Klebsiella michiganensis]|uniref:cob(I)yrinic acid a,c-diamide adenosyltransferase n=1 Tax=Klebsiella michiganensis TaxID=1134687 RepID=UPI001643EA25|nr:cob(I)yrinic acid a,c-diamide adenosyltransferase [Klebsiella michiganensis]MBC3634749.1 cob(I)yrinic acid a,c-diamide adenosyltransferase [Klebsiella michiganensis]MDU8002711.1 cob(I)yrinic acid a,c-diamide adenosyltransferase [Klebsiella sp.]
MHARGNPDRHRQRQQKLKTQVATRVAAATEQKGILIVFTGNGKGKSTAAFGTATRAVGHGKRVGAAQFIKGQWDNGEYNTLHPLGVEFHIMGTGFTWETQNREADIEAASAVWQESKRMLADPSYDLVVLDEITYMLAYHYLDTQEVIAAIENRPPRQNVIVTGRGCHTRLLELADTVSELRPVKHAFDSGVQAQEGIDW